MITEFLKQLPIAGAFVLFMMWELTEQRKERAADRDARLTVDEEWRKFLIDQRMAWLASLDVVSLRLQTVGDMVLSLDRRFDRFEETFDKHDARAERIAVMLVGDGRQGTGALVGKG